MNGTWLVARSADHFVRALDIYPQTLLSNHPLQPWYVFLLWCSKFWAQWPSLSFTTTVPQAEHQVYQVWQSNQYYPSSQVAEPALLSFPLCLPMSQNCQTSHSGSRRSIMLIKLTWLMASCLHQMRPHLAIWYSLHGLPGSFIDSHVWIEVHVVWTQLTRTEDVSQYWVLLILVHTCI